MVHVACCPEVENLVESLNAAECRLTEIMATPKPNYSVDGQSVSWGDFRKSLIENIRELQTMINERCPFELKSRGYPS